jgi:ABC-2 type transport system permease protein
MRPRKILAIAHKDLSEVRQNTYAWLPMVIVPVMFVIVLPLVMIYLPQVSGLSAEEMALDDPDIQTFLANMPDTMRQPLEGLSGYAQMIVVMLGFMLAPLFLILPIMTSSVIAAESFAGERERGTIEALLYSAASDSDLFLGKALAAAAPAVLLTWISFAAYVVVLNLASNPIVGRAWFPMSTWYPLILWVSPALSLLGTGATVLISARVKTFLGAYQTGSMLVLLVLGLLIGQISGVLYLSVDVGMAVGALIWLVAGVLLFFGVQTFNRTGLVSSI